MKQVGVGIIGAGSIALANHLPGLALDRRARVVALCDADPATLERAGRQAGVEALHADFRELLARDDVHAVIVATPNFAHREIVLAACAARRHVMCEKPLALDLASAAEMRRAADAAGVRHMTAFTYRFVPAMRYAKHLVDAGAVGAPYHFRAQRFQDWRDRPLGWRQVKALAGTGEMGDMLSHRIDYAHHLIGPIASLVGDLRTLLPERGGRASDVDDWVALIARFAGSDATGVLESTKLATGRGEGHRGQDVVEVNGSEGTIVYSTQKPLQLSIGKTGDADLRQIDVPREFLTWPGSPRDPAAGDPLATFRYDQDFEFIDAIANDRPCRPSFAEGVAAQAVMEAALRSHAQRGWVDVERT
ncbi:MAG TPA: Gfo/Idh/MocA family oxidoreductase [Tepidisphaeraceae bacterium]|nr:Gfo/Idh/MocA family oxidoreductase [Tepidisphaeraceae bacterium]